MSLKKCTELLQCRNEKIDIEGLEESNNFKLPVLYKAFVKIFDLKFQHSKILFDGKEHSFLAKDFFRNDVFSERTYKHALGYEHGGIGFDEFKPIQDVFLHRNNDDNWIDNGYLPIGICSDNGLLLGYHEDNYDEIFFECRFLPDDGIVKIADSIFEFMSYVKEYSFNLYVNEIPFSSMYKTWNGNIWLVESDSKIV